MSATVAQYPVEQCLPRQTVRHNHVVDHQLPASTNYGVQVRGVTLASRKDTHQDNEEPHEPERIALVLDMDECLVHSRFRNDCVEYRQQEYRPTEEREYKDSFEITMDDGETALVHKRPGLDQFLEEASKHFDLYVFTAGLETYGKPILDLLDPKGTLFRGRFFRESCQVRKGMFLKDLYAVRSDLSRVILVDNNPVSFLMQPSNGIPVPSFYDDANDRSLESLMKVLQSLKNVKDVRPRLHQLFRLADLLAEHQRAILS